MFIRNISKRFKGCSIQIYKLHPHSTLSGAQPVLKKTRNWFLPLDKMQPQIEAYIDSHKEWRANVYGQCKSWLSDCLHPREMTRDLDWGVDAACVQ